MIKKTYTGTSNVNVRVLLSFGTSAQVNFEPIIGGGSVFVTTDTDLQSALESHAKFGKLFTLDSQEEVAYPITKPKVVYSDKESDTGGSISFLPQTLTEQEKAQARENIGAATEPSELEHVLKYTEQSLSDSDKGQARENIDAQEKSEIISDNEMDAWLS